jgi:hypothetical protein
LFFIVPDFNGGMPSYSLSPRIYSIEAKAATSWFDSMGETIAFFSQIFLVSRSSHTS